jgi:hypothetical protein
MKAQPRVKLWSSGSPSEEKRNLSRRVWELPGWGGPSVRLPFQRH